MISRAAFIWSKVHHHYFSLFPFFFLETLIHFFKPGFLMNRKILFETEIFCNITHLYCHFWSVWCALDELFSLKKKKRCNAPYLLKNSVIQQLQWFVLCFLIKKKYIYTSKDKKYVLLYLQKIIALKSNTMPYYVTCLEMWTQGRTFDCLLLTFEETLHIFYLYNFLQKFCMH